jgi:3-oxoacyl-[acyl-carrier-protein] synthase II
MGAVTPVGNDLSATWDGLVAGRSGIGPVTHFDASEFRTPLSAEVKKFKAADKIEAKPLKHMDLNVQYAVVAAQEAMADSGLAITSASRDRAGVIIGSGGGGTSTVLHWYDVLNAKGPRRVSPFFMSNFIADAASGHVAISLGIRGPNFATTSACASGTNAIADGAMQIRLDKADVMVVGGSEAVLQPLFHACFEAMRVMAPPGDPPSATMKPFDKDRAGFVPGEGAAIMVIEELEQARSRGARIYAELIGSGSGNDGYDMAAPDPDGRGLRNSMEQSLRETDIDREQIGYINLHGTATPIGDKVEVAVVREVFGENAENVLISSIKAATGHMMAASGALEAMVAVLALSHGVIPPTLNFTTPDLDCDLDCVPNSARQVELSAAMSVSVGLGGHNAAVLFKRWNG